MNFSPQNTTEHEITLEFNKISMGDVSQYSVIVSSETINKMRESIPLDEQDTKTILSLLNSLITKKSLPLPSAYITRISAPKGQDSNEELPQEKLLAEIKEIYKDLIEAFEKWLKPVKDYLENKLDREDKHYCIIRIPHQSGSELTDEEFSLYYLPFEEWNFFKKYTQASYAFARQSHEYRPIKSKRGRAKMLTILGHDTNIDVTKDSQILKKKLRSQIDIVTVKLEKQKEINGLLWDEQCDILFYAGHSKTQNKEGLIGDVAIGNLVRGFQELIGKGLQIAIFNSCDALGVAIPLQALNLPVIVIMRERIPDDEAHEFIYQFLKFYVTQSKHVFEAVRLAREKMQGDKPKQHLKPCPLVFQNPSKPAPLWREILPFTRTHWLWTFPAVLTSSLLALLCGQTLLIQKAELPIYDSMLRQKVALNEVEKNQHIVIVAIDDSYQDQYISKDIEKTSISNKKLTELINIINQKKPYAIVLDIVRSDEKYNSLLAKNNKNLYFGCYPANHSAPGVPIANQVSVAILGDKEQSPSQAGVIRSYGLSKDPNDRDEVKHCKPKFPIAIAMADLLAQKSQQEGYTGEYKTFQQEFYIDFSGWKQNQPRSLRVVSINDVFRRESQDFENKIVLIGVTRPDNDTWMTPVGESYGVYIHGEAIVTLLNFQEQFGYIPDAWVTESLIPTYLVLSLFSTYLAWFLGSRYRYQIFLIAALAPASYAVDLFLFLMFGIFPATITLFIGSALGPCIIMLVLYLENKPKR